MKLEILSECTRSVAQLTLVKKLHIGAFLCNKNSRLDGFKFGVGENKEKENGLCTCYIPDIF